MLTAEELFGEMYKRDDPIYSLKCFATATNNNDRELYPRVLDHILHTEPTILFKDYNEILKTIDIVAYDSEETVRASLSSWLVKICSCLLLLDQKNCTVFGCLLLDRVLEIILKYMSDESSVRVGAFKTFVYLIEHGFLDKNTVEHSVCPVIVQLSQIPTTTFDEDIHTHVIYMMTKIAPIIGYQKTYEVLYGRFVELTLDKTSVRKQCATAFPVMCEVLGNVIFETNMLPIFMRLCDDSVWSVRRACAEVMPKMALLCTLENRRKYLVPAVKKFMFDPSQWVIMTALKHLGQFLTTFAQLQILGLAYDYRLELFITNAADEEFRQKCDVQMLSYSNQPNSDLILKNFESYEKMFEESIPTAALVVDDVQKQKEDKVNIESFLSSIVFMEMKTGRLSITSDSDDGGISKISDYPPYKYCYVFHQKPMKSTSSSTMSSSSASTSSSPLYNNQHFDDTNPLSKFFKYCAPLKNNFLNSPISTNYDYSDDDNELMFFDDKKVRLMGALRSRIKNDKQKLYNNANDLQGGANEFSTKKLFSKLINNFKSNPNNNNEENDNGTGTGTNKRSVYDLSKLGLENNNNDVGNKSVDDEDENAIDQRYNSHQFWYISPELPLDLDFIDKDATVETTTTTTTANLSNSVDDTNNNNNTNNNNTINASDEEDVVNSSVVEDQDASDIFYSVAQQQKINNQQQMIKENKLLDIVNWENEEVEWNLLEDFVYMKDINDEMCYECAYNFPAIILTFGKKFWPILHKHFITLCNDLQNSVRKTMAASIGKIATIIGREQATPDLVIPYVEFFNDVDEIKIEVVKSLAEFVRVVDSSEHEVLISQLGLCLTPPINTINWRFRETVALQIKELVKIHKQIKKENCLLYLAGLSLRLMIDKYDCVRKAGIDAFVLCCHHMQTKEKVFQFWADSFANYTNWRRRQTYIITANKLLAEELLEADLFQKYILVNLLNLADDQIPNVRIQAARCLTKTVLQHPYFNNPDMDELAVIKQVISNLETDVDRDVRDQLVFNSYTHSDSNVTMSHIEYHNKCNNVDEHPQDDLPSHRAGEDFIGGTEVAEGVGDAVETAATPTLSSSSSSSPSSEFIIHNSLSEEET